MEDALATATATFVMVLLCGVTPTILASAIAYRIIKGTPKGQGGAR